MGKMKEIFRATLLSKYRVAYFRCQVCGFLCTEHPYWLEEAYKSTINITDTGMLQRNLILSRITSAVLFFLHAGRGRYVDFAGGYGLLTRLMRDIGFDFYWTDPKCRNLFARGFEYRPETGISDLATCFESYEHFVDPVTETGKILEISKEILISTELIHEPIPEPDKWWYYGLEHGQHISFYTLASMNRIASQYGCRLYSDGRRYHFITKRRLLPGAFATYVSLGHVGLAQIVRRIMKSRTLDDMRAIIASGPASNNPS